MLRSDMAKRIMYSILPSVSDSAEVFGTQGVVDYKALSAAAEGRHRLIKYGTRACIREINHYAHGGNLINEALLKEHETKNYLTITQKAMEVFADTTGWGTSFGGKPWFNIAQSLHKMITYDQELAIANQQRNCSADCWEQCVQIMRSLIIEMNVLDGLAHNTASIMINLTNEEAMDTKGSGNSEFLRIKELMDAKELINPIDVYRIIEKTLIESGDISRYKDWTKRLRSCPEYLKPLDNTEELFRIRFRKLHMISISKLNIIIDSAKAKVQEMSPEPPIPNLIFNAEGVALFSWIDNISRNTSYLMSEYQNKDGANNKKIYDICNSVYRNVDTLLSSINIATAEYSDIFNNDALKLSKINEAITHINSISCLLSSI